MWHLINEKVCVTCYLKFWPDLKPVMGIFWKRRTFNSGHFTTQER